MMWKTMAVLVIGLAVGIVAAAPDDKKKDEDKIQGTWLAASLEEGGEKQPEEKTKAIKIVFAAEGKVTVTTGKKDVTGTFNLDSTKKVKEITLKAEGEGTLLGIYKLDGDELTMCIAHEGQDQRPTEFATKAGTKIGLVVLKREKK